jgi:hypothetical protein
VKKSKVFGKSRFGRNITAIMVKNAGSFVLNVLILQIEGFHSGGGLTASAIQKIIRKKEDE